DAATRANRDAQYRPLPGFPGLRSDRLLAALGATAQSPEQRRLWLQRLAERDAQASAIELGNLPDGERQHWNARQAELQVCRNRQVERLAEDESAFREALAAAQVADDYRDWARVLGLYPLFEPIYRRGVARWQTEAAL